MKLIKHQAGLTLIELMVAGLLSVLVAFFIGNIVVSSNRSSTTNSGSAEAQESARFISTWLQQEIRRAAYSPSIAGSDLVPFAPLCVAPYDLPPANGAGCTYDSRMGDSPNDRIAINWLYTVDSENPRDQDTCNGTELVGIPDGTVLVDVYWITVGNQNDGYDDSLWCATYNGTTNTIIGTAQAIAAGIVGLQVQYGESPGINANQELETLKNVTRYVDATQVMSWDNVMTAKIAILTRSFNALAINEEKRAYILLDGEPYEYEDQVTRYPFTLTVDLPNKNWK